MDYKYNSSSSNDISESSLCQRPKILTAHTTAHKITKLTCKPATEHYSELKFTPLSIREHYSSSLKKLGHCKPTDLLNWILRKKFPDN